METRCVNNGTNASTHGQARRARKVQQRRIDCLRRGPGIKEPRRTEQQAQRHTRGGGMVPTVFLAHCFRKTPVVPSIMPPIVLFLQGRFVLAMQSLLLRVSAPTLTAELFVPGICAECALQSTKETKARLSLTRRQMGFVRHLEKAAGMRCSHFDIIPMQAREQAGPVLTSTSARAR